METRRLLWYMALAFSLVLMVQYIKLPYGYVMSSLLSIGKSGVASAGSFSINETGSSANPVFSGGPSQNVTNLLGERKPETSNDRVVERSSPDFLEMNLSNESLAAEPGGEQLVHELPESSYTTVRNSTADSLQGTDAETGGEQLVHELPESSYTMKNSTADSLQGTDAETGGEQLVHELPESSYTTVKNSTADSLQGTDAETGGEQLVHELPESSYTMKNSTADSLQGTDAETGGEQLVHKLPESSYTTVKNSTADSLQGTDAVPSSIIDEERASPSHATSPARERPSLRHGQLSTEVNSSAIRRAPRSARLKGSPAVVVPISEMNDLLRQSRVSYHSMNARWPSQADEDLLNAKRLIESADSVKKNPRVDVSIYRNFSAFTRSYELMEQTLKIYIYSEGERPVFHEPELNGIYASEGWFMKQLQESKHFVTKNGNKAHLFYLPFSSHVLQEVLYVPGSHSRKNLVRYLSSYLKNITSTHRFWDRTNGTDHFLVACHDWAPAETGRIMSNCIRALCNANVMGGFRFGRDVSLPETYVRNAMSPLKGLGGKPPSQRHVLAFFAGKMHGYLRPLLLDYWEGKDPDMKISGKLQKGNDRTSYAQYMKSSKYCISAKGYEPYTPRVMEAIFYECVPVILSDNYVPPFFETLDWESFAVFILERDIPNLKKILESIPEKRYVEMQQRVRLVQKHFLWHDKPMKFDIFHMVLHSLWYTRVLQMGA